ncbi:MAG TPA: cation diffusion facilitator family transporter [Bryobacteraceae bacterium]|jgi:cobalt-zinc-cadmium efflux system protein|nr:cation diffusion facilitator family transporter [Bryobacteraceae bacterium]
MHSHAPGAHCHHEGTGRILKWSTLATVLFVLIEFVAGIKAGSLALLSDAGHNLTDAFALVFTWFAFYLQSKPANEVKTYGYHRSGVLAAFVNALTLVALSVWIFYESYHRFRHPEPVQENIMIAVSILGLFLNGGVMWGLWSARSRDINVRSAFVHMLGDALGSVAIVAGAIVILYTGWLWIDAALSVAIGALIVWTAWDIVNESLNILLEGLPRGLELQTVISAIREVPGVLEVHDLHIWSLGSSTHALSCHAVIEDVPPSASDRILQRLNNMLCDRFSIRHTTVQFEHVGCAVSEIGCVIPTGSHAHHQH